jgi:UDP-N-acetylmuramoyl-tripeptide--D-alanyl-D-alanine ligase
MEVVILVTLFWAPALFVLIKKFLWDLYFWQLKEYRWDRFWTHIRWDQEESNRNFYFLGVKFILFACLTLLFESPVLALIALLLTYIIWVFESFEYIKDIILGQTIKASVRSFRNILILLINLSVPTIIVVLVTAPFTLIDRGKSVLSSPELNEYIQSVTTASPAETIPDIFILLAFIGLIGLFFDIASPFFSPFGVFLTWPLSFLKRQQVIIKASKKYAALSGKLTMIAITGSQGKTTTKEILYEILKDRYKTAKTPENYNTDFGVATSILNEVHGNTDIFIAEMGAYRTGEIQKIVKMFPPDIGVITDISTQHIGLFGGYMKVAEAKSEIVRFLKPGGKAILNGDSNLCRSVASELGEFTVLVTTEKGNSESADLIETPKIKNVTAKNIEFKNNTLRFSFVDDDAVQEYEIHGAAKHLVSNFMIAISIAREVGMSLQEIAESIKKSKMTLPRLSFETGDNDTRILNDTYSSSVKGFKAAVEYLNEVYDGKGKRIIITKGILELGREKRSLYRDLVREMEGGFDVLITSDTLLSNIVKKENTSVQVVKVSKADEMLYSFRAISEPGDYILLEGRLSPSLVKNIISDKK